MFRTVRIETRYPASSKPHARRLASSFFFRQKLDAFTRKRVMKKLAIVGACMRFNPFQCRWRSGFARTILSLWTLRLCFSSPRKVLPEMRGID
jgi:hypothetical protein